MKQFQTNKYGNIDIRNGLPRGSTHIPREEYEPVRIKNVCDNLGVAYAPALTGFVPSWKYRKPVIDGVLVWSRCRPKVMAEVESRKSKARSKPSERKPRNYSKQFEKKYDCKRDALLDAAHAMFNLNRFCKHRKCTKSERNYIYMLKNDFVEFLYKRGHSTDVGIHRLDRDALICWGCDGFGCKRCGYTGEYMPPDHIEYVVFHFEIDGVPFCWHQPQQSIDYEFEITKQGESMPDIPVKGLEIETKKFQKKKSIALVKWVMENQSRAMEAA